MEETETEGQLRDKNGQSMVIGSTDLHGVHEDQQRCLKGSTKRLRRFRKLSYKILKLEDKEELSKVWWVESVAFLVGHLLTSENTLLFHVGSANV